MASRKEQKEQARAARLAQEQHAASQAQRIRRLQILGGVIVSAVIVIVAAIIISSSGGTKPESVTLKAAVKHVDALLAGIPESGNTLGKANAPVTITEYGDLECSVCDVLAAPASFTNPEAEQGSGWEDKLISTYVRTGKAKLVYKSLETASGGNPDGTAFERQQVAAEAAGLQGKEWYFVELMYNDQGAEGSAYVTESYLDSLAKRIPGLNYNKWLSDRKLASLKSEVSSDNTAGTAVDVAVPGVGGASTPTVVISGPIGQAKPIVGLNGGYGAYVSAINQVK